MWDIIRLPRWRVCVDLCLENKDEMVWRIKSIIHICRLTCASGIPCLRTSGYNIGRDLGFERIFSVDMVLGTPVGSPLGYSMNMLLRLALWNYFGTLEVSLVGVSIVTLDGLMIGTGEVSLVGLSLEIPLGSPLESPNPGSGLPGTLLGTPLGLWFGYELVMCLCCRRQLMDFHKSDW